MLKYVAALGLFALFVGGAVQAKGPWSEPTADTSVHSGDWDQMDAAYAAQQPVLQNELGQSVFVASFKGLESDGHIVSFSIWTDGAKTALPKTDFVWLQNREMSRWFVVPWSDLEAGIGKLAEIEGVSPPRYVTPTNIPPSYFSGLEKSYVAPKGFPAKLATGRR